MTPARRGLPHPELQILETTLQCGVPSWLNKGKYQYQYTTSLTSLLQAMTTMTKVTTGTTTEVLYRYSFSAGTRTRMSRPTGACRLITLRRTLICPYPSILPHLMLVRCLLFRLWNSG